MASMKVQRKTVNRWGIYMKEKNIDKKNFYIKDVVEKPNINDAPSILSPFATRLKALLPIAFQF